MSQTSADKSKRRPPHEKAVDEHQGADWGFDSDDADPAIEKKLGIVLVLCLLAGFGFVFYQKFRILQEHGPSAQGDEVAAADTPAPEGTIEQHTPAPRGGSADTPPAPASAVGSPFYNADEQTPAPKNDWTLTHAEAPETSIHTPAPVAARSHPDSSGTFDPFTEPAADATRPAARDEAPTITWGESAAPAPRQSEPEPFLIDESEIAADDAASAATPSLPAETSEPPAPAPPGPDDEPGLFVFNLPDESPSNDAANPTTPERDAGPQPPMQRGTEEGPESRLMVSDEPPAPIDPPASGDQFDPFAISEDDQPDTARTSEPPSKPFPFIAPPPHEESAPREPAPVAITDPPAWPFAEAAPTADAEPQSSPHTQRDELPHIAVDPSPFPSTHASPNVSPSSSTQAAPNPFAMESVAPRPVITSIVASQAVIGERQITVTQRDSFWSISEREYGTSRYFAALARYNRDSVAQPDKLRSGMKVRIPPPEVLEAQFPELFQNPEWRDRRVSPISGTSASFAESAGLVVDEHLQPWYRVGERDTLSSIAQEHLGRASRWTEIYDLNRDQLTSPSTLKVGMVLKLPADAGRVSVSPAGGFSR